MSRDRTTLTILFTDVVGSTALGADLGDDRALGILGHSAALVRGAVEEAGGREIKSLGDGSLSTFRGPRAAISAATAIQKAHADWQTEDGGIAVSVRIGIHTGEVDESDVDIHGEAVNAAARICASADGDQILISSTARGAAGSGAGLSFSDPEPVELKGFPAPFELSSVGWRSPGPDQSPDPVPMEQRIRFCEVEGQRVAWSQVGSGPPLVVPSPWISNLQTDWENRPYRSF
ncbi:MAG: adenylate/guanylate cyclase domain-containing protein, partial [Acidobacteriota bacterium]